MDLLERGLNAVRVRIAIRLTVPPHNMVQIPTWYLVYLLQLLPPPTPQYRVNLSRVSLESSGFWGDQQGHESPPAPPQRIADVESASESTIKEKTTPGVAAGTAPQVQDKDERVREVVNLLQVATPAEKSSRIDGNSSSRADRELHRGLTRDSGARSDESRPLAQAQQDNVQGVDDKSNHNVVDGGDECWDQALATGTSNACFFSSDTSEQAPPSPLPSPPVPLSPTARQDSYFLWQLPPSRVPCASASFCFRENKGYSRACDDEPSTLVVGSEEKEVNAAIAQNEGLDAGKVLPPPESLFSENSAWDPVVGGRCESSSSVNGDVIDRVSPQGVGYSPQPSQRRCKSLPETLLRGINGQTNNHAPADMLHRGEEADKTSSPPPYSSPGDTRPAFCDRPGIILAPAPDGQMSPSVPCPVRGLDKGQPPLHGAQDGLDKPVPASSSHTAEEASATTNLTSLQQGEHSKTAAAVLILQRWLRRVILISNNFQPPKADVSAQSIHETPTMVEKGFKGPQPMEISPSAALHHSAASFVAPPSKDKVQNPSSGANPGAGEDEMTGHAALFRRPAFSRRRECSDVEAGMLLPEMGNVWRPANHALREHKPSHRAFAVRALDRSHSFPRRRAFSINDLEVTPPGGRDSVGTAPVPFSQDSGSNGKPSRPSSNIKSAVDVGRSSAPRRASNTGQGLNTRSPHGVGFVVPAGRIAGVDEVPKTGHSVYFSLPPGSLMPTPPPLQPWASSMLRTPALPRVPSTGILEAGRCSINHVCGGPVGNSSGWSTRVEGRRASPSSGFPQYQLERRVAVKSATPLNEGVAPAESRFEIDTGYSLTVLEACLHRNRSPGRGNRASHGGPGCYHAVQSKSRCPDTVQMASNMPPVLTFPRPNEEQGLPASVAGAVSRHYVAVTSRGLASNPLLLAWGVGNPLLNAAAVVTTRLNARCGIASSKGVAPHS